MDAALIQLILERLAIGKRVGFRYRTLERFGADALQRALDQGVLRETHRAEAIEHPDPNAPTRYDMEVRYYENGIYAVSAENDVWVEPLLLMDNDLRQFELVLSRVCARICAENFISQAIRENEHEIVYLGERDLDGYGSLMTYFLYANVDELPFLERCRRISGENWTVVLTPTPVNLSLMGQRQVASLRLLLVPMSHYLNGHGWALAWRKIAASLPGRARAISDFSPVQDLVYENLPGLECSPDFRTVRLRGETFSLTTKMAQLFQGMVEMSQRGPRDLDKYAILERGETTCRSLNDIFKHMKNWKKLIVPGRLKGTYRINITIYGLLLFFIENWGDILDMLDVLDAV